MPLSPQTQAVATLNEVNALCVLLNQFLLRAAALNYLPNPAPLWQAMATAPLNADGSLGNADDSPNNAHPIDARVIPGLNRACSEAQYQAALTLIQALVSGQVTSQNIAILAPFLGG